MFTNKSLPPQGKYVLITGASSGLGRETALYLAERGFQVIGSVRRQEDGEKLSADCRVGRIVPLIIDVTDDRSIAAAAAQVSTTVGERGFGGWLIMRGFVFPPLWSVYRASCFAINWRST